MTMRMRTCLLLAGTWLAPALAQEHIDSSISPERRQQMELRTCQAWRSRPIDTLHTELSLGGSLRVNIDCAVHGDFQGHPLRGLAYCEGAGDEWKCDDAGVQMNLGSESEPRLVRMVDVTPEKALEILAFMAAEARKGKRIRTSLLEGYLTLVGLPGRHYYAATFNFGDYETALEIHADCGRRSCRYRLGRIETYATYRNW